MLKPLVVALVPLLCACGGRVAADAEASSGTTSSDSEAPTASEGSTESDASSSGPPPATTTGGTTPLGSTTGDNSSSGDGWPDDAWPEEPRPTCGDGVVDPGEECDDGNINDGDGCRHDCVPSAAVVWDAIVPGPESFTCAYAVAATDAARIVVGGGTSGGDVDAWFALLDDAGALVWQRRWDGEDGEGDVVSAVGDDGETALYAWTSEGQDSTTIPHLSRWDAAGALQWDAEVSCTEDAPTFARALAVRPDGSLSVSSAGPSTGCLQHIDVDGTSLWPEPPQFDDVSSQSSMSLDTDTLGGTRVVSHRGGGVWLRRYDASGALDWSLPFDPPVASAAAALLPNDHTIVAMSDIFGDALVLRTWSPSGQGAEVFVPGFTNELDVTAAATNVSGDTFVVGQFEQRAWVLRIDAAGTLLWSRRGLEGSEAYDVAIAPNGDIIVSGCLEEATTAAWVRRLTP